MIHRCHKGGWICGPACEEHRRLVPAWQRKLTLEAAIAQEVMTSEEMDQMERDILSGKVQP
jgi:hypothetical protein